MYSGWCVWVTGLPGSGKSTIAQTLLQKLKVQGIRAQILSSDMLRKFVTPKPTYSSEERDMVYATLVFLAQLLTQNNINVIIDATGNLRRYRDNARKEITKFIEAYLECPKEVCIQRETKRKNTHHAPQKIYKKAYEGKAPTVPGLGAPYEPPLNPEVTVDTTKLTPEQCAQKIIDIITRNS